MTRHDVRVLVYSGSYASALAVRSLLKACGIPSSLEDIPASSHGQPDSKVYVALGHAQRALPLVADFRAANRSQDDTRK